MLEFTQFEFFFVVCIFFFFHLPTTRFINTSLQPTLKYWMLDRPWKHHKEGELAELFLLATTLPHDDDDNNNIITIKRTELNFHAVVNLMETNDWLECYNEYKNVCRAPDNGMQSIPRHWSWHMSNMQGLILLCSSEKVKLVAKILHLNPSPRRNGGPWMRQLLTGCSILSVWYQGMRICKWALSISGLQKLDHYTADDPVRWPFGLCQHNLQSNTVWNAQGHRNTCVCKQNLHILQHRSVCLFTSEHAFNPRSAFEDASPFATFDPTGNKKYRRDVRWHFGDFCIVCAHSGGNTSEASLPVLSRKLEKNTPDRSSPSQRIFFPRASKLSVHWTVPPESFKSVTFSWFPIYFPLSLSCPLAVSSLLSLA